MSQEELAGRARCSKMQISGLKRGKPELTVHWMRRIADALGVHPAELLRKDDNPHGAATEEEHRMLATFREAPHAFQHQLIAMSEAVATLTDTPDPTFVPVQIDADTSLFAPLDKLTGPLLRVTHGDSMAAGRYVTWSAFAPNRVSLRGRWRRPTSNLSRPGSR
jgi:transcriptional regulator with XRE-family HTH domain